MDNNDAIVIGMIVIFILVHLIFNDDDEPETFYTRIKKLFDKEDKK